MFKACDRFNPVRSTINLNTRSVLFSFQSWFHCNQEDITMPSVDVVTAIYGMTKGATMLKAGRMVCRSNLTN